MAKVKRQANLYERYFFHCQCVGCTSEHWRRVEEEMTAIMCQKCKRTFVEENTTQCNECGEAIDARERKRQCKAFELLLKTSADATQIVNSLELVESRFHTNNHQLNSLRSSAVNVLLAKKAAKMALPIILRHVRTLFCLFPSCLLYITPKGGDFDEQNVLSTRRTIISVRTLSKRRMRC